MAKKQENQKEEKIKVFKCDNCKFYTDKCVHESNLLIHLKRRIETIEYKSLDKKEKCRFFECLDKD